MENYYSQHGEDFLINKIFKNKSEGYFVEVGCLDGIEYSNTYYFEKKGWKGLCIEAHQDFISALKRNRPQSKIVHCAIGEKDIENVTFYANKAGSLSTLDKGEEERWRKSYSNDFHGFDEQRVSMRTLSSVFDELKLTSIDFVSLDIEGYEVKALAGLDFSKYKPIVFIIEYKDENHKRELEEILFSHQYHFLSQVGCNLFYSTNPSYKKIMSENHGTVTLTKIDANGVAHYHKRVLTDSAWSKIKSKLRKTFVGNIWDFMIGDQKTISKKNK
jgi:FkbM family methyltransferase